MCEGRSLRHYCFTSDCPYTVRFLFAVDCRDNLLYNLQITNDLIRKADSGTAAVI